MRMPSLFVDALEDTERGPAAIFTQIQQRLQQQLVQAGVTELAQTGDVLASSTWKVSAHPRC